MLCALRLTIATDLTPGIIKNFRHLGAQTSQETQKKPAKHDPLRNLMDALVSLCNVAGDGV